MKSKKLVVAIAVILLAIVGFIFWKISQSNVLSPDKGEFISNPIIKNDSYSYGMITLNYAKNLQLSQPDQAVTVYITENGKKSELIHEFPIDVPGGEMPIFRATTKPNIALLSIQSGDLGGYYSTSYYIDTITKNVLGITYNGFLEITDNVNTYQIGYVIDNPRDTDSKDGDKAMLKDLTLNNKPLGILKQPLKLTVTNAESIGPAYKEMLSFGYGTIKEDLSKLFFNFQYGGDEYYGEEFGLSLSFDLNTKSVIVENEPLDTIRAQ